MRGFLVMFLFALVHAGTTATAQDRARVMYIGPAPEYSLSMGLGIRDGDQVTISARLEVGADCRWRGVQRVVVPLSDVLALREADGEDAILEIYPIAVARLGGVLTEEKMTCARNAFEAARPPG